MQGSDSTICHGGRPDEAEIKDFVKTNLARSAVPRDVVFLSELPRNAAGKVLKRELRSSHPTP